MIVADAWKQPRGVCFRTGGMLGLAILVAGLVAQRAFPATEPAKLRVLILSGLNNHDWRSTSPVIKTCSRMRPIRTVDVTENPAGLNAAILARYDVLVSN
jgi:hypothetical protein